MALTGGLSITSWDLTPLNPDGTVNSFLPTISGSVPADISTDIIDFLAMGNRMQVSFVCELSGTFPDSSATTVVGSTIRYNPALFLEYLGIFYPPGTFPQGGYSIQIPGSFNPSVGGSYSMPLIGQKEFINCNINGEVEIDITGSQDFVITHTLYLAADVEQYPGGRIVPNYFRFSKSSVYNDEEGSVDRPSVFSYVKGLNVLICLKNGVYNLFAPDLSIPFNAAFSGFENDGELSTIQAEFTIERLAVPGVAEDNISPFEDNLVKITITDPSALVVEDESEIQLVNRTLDRNISTFIEDFQIKQTKLVTTGSSASLDGAIYGPATWSQSAGVTEITFVLSGTDLTKTDLYQLHFRAGVNNGPSGNKMLHFMSEAIPATGAPVENPFTIESQFWTRNGQSGGSFSISPAERATSVLSMNVTEYNTLNNDPWIDFDGDIQQVAIQILDSAGTEVFTATMLKNDDNTWTDTEFIGFYEESGPSIDTIYHFYLNEFRVPYLNYQGLSDWEGDTLTFRWSAIFQDQRSDEFSGEYYQDTELIVGEFEDSAVSPQVTNIQFLNPDTLEVITDWHNLTTVRVTAEIPNADPNTYVAVMVDQYPLGVSLFSDYALEEEDPTTHSLPPYVIFEQKVTDLVSELPDQPTDGGISFLLDISELSGEMDMYLYIQAYQA